MQISELYTLTAMPAERGELLNNPTNMDKGEPWLGLALDQPDDRFCKFISPEYGYRAAIIAMRTHQGRAIRKGLSFTLPVAVEVWAPPNENNTKAYIANVNAWTGFGTMMPLNTADMLLMQQLLSAITRQEQGRCIYPDELIQHGLYLAGGWNPATVGAFR